MFTPRYLNATLNQTKKLRDILKKALVQKVLRSILGSGNFKKSRLELRGLWMLSNVGDMTFLNLQISGTMGGGNQANSEGMGMPPANNGNSDMSPQSSLQALSWSKSPAGEYLKIKQKS